MSGPEGTRGEEPACLGRSSMSILSFASGELQGAVSME